ncbi:MAG: SDR family oxidoreductase [Actinomycetota bacterium]|nr:SDR family oxidoreductase [Actinomycetota bacterium]
MEAGTERVAMVTGASNGIGRVTALELVRQGWRVHLACRSFERTRPVIEEARAIGGAQSVSFLQVDLADLASVAVAATAFRRMNEPMHLLVNNAGVAGLRGMTHDGFELAFGVNHLGHFHLTTLLLDIVRESAPARIVHVASVAHFQAKGINFDKVRGPTPSFTGLPEYAVSKLANVLFSAQLAERLAGTGVTSNSLHPGAVASNIWKRVPRLIRPVVTRRMLTAEQGARTSLYCATDPAVADVSGSYFDDCHETAPSPVATRELGQELWARSVEFTATGG